MNTQSLNPSPLLVGGNKNTCRRRRGKRGGRKGVRSLSNKIKGTFARWRDHLKAYSKKFNVSYRDAMTSSHSKKLFKRGGGV